MLSPGEGEKLRELHSNIDSSCERMGIEMGQRNTIAHVDPNLLVC